MNKEKARKILMIIGFAICMATLAVSIVFIAKIIELDVLRKTLIGVIIALASVLLIIIGITQRWIVPGIITKIVAIAMIVAMMFCIKNKWGQKSKVCRENWNKVRYFRTKKEIYSKKLISYSNQIIFFAIIGIVR